MALSLAACRPVAARRLAAARRAPAAARRARLVPAGPVRPCRPLLCTAPEREPEPAKAPQPQQPPQAAPPQPPPPPRLSVKPAPPPPPPSSRAPASDKQPRPKPPLHPFIGFLLSFFDRRNVRARGARRPCARAAGVGTRADTARPACASQFVRLLLKLLAFSALAQLLGSGIGKTSGVDQTVVRHVTVSSQYSDFLRATKTGQVAQVQLDGKGLAWRTRDAAVIKPLPKAASRGAAELGGAPAVEVTQTWYTALRPDDAPVPYDELLAGGANFHAVNRARQFNLMNAFNVVVRALCPALGATRAALRQATTDLRCFLAPPLATAALTRLAAGDGAVADADGVGGDWARHAQPDGHVQEPRRGAEQARQARGAGGDLR